MSWQTDCTEEEKKVSRLAKGRKTLEISKEVYCDHRTIKRPVINVNHKGKGQTKVWGENCQDAEHLS